MGDIIYPPPESYPPGNDCGACTPALFESGHWPQLLYVKFTGMSPCTGFATPPNNHWFTLVQTPSPCRYQVLSYFYGYEWWLDLELLIARLRLWNQDQPGGITFWGTADPCSLIFPTNIATCPANNAEGGSALVTAEPTPLTSLLCSSYGLMPWGHYESPAKIAQLRTRTESQEVAVDHTLVRLANRADKSCVYVYIDDEDLPQ